MKLRHAAFLAITIAASGCATHTTREQPAPLVGAWRSSVNFDSGPFATLADLEFLYVFNAGGTLTESSNFDAVPPVAPAYGAWTQVGPNEFVASYEFFVTKPPARVEELATGGGWLPDGRGRFDERIVVAADSASFDSTFTYAALKADGSDAAEPVTGKAHAVRITPVR